MRKYLIRALCMLLTFIILAQSVYADIGTNIDGGSGNLGQGSVNNGWVVQSTGGGMIFDADGLRVYIVNASTGVPVSSAIDITTHNIANTNVVNFGQTTKHEYNHVNGNLTSTDFYDYTKIPASLNFPRIVSNSMTANAAADAARVDAIKDWFTDINHFEWTIGQFGFSVEEMQAQGYMIAIEPIAYFRYQGENYAMTATEAALFDQLTGGALTSAMGPLTRQNLPLALFLEEDEFTNSPFRIDEWLGSRNSYASNVDILSQLGIGLIDFFRDTFHSQGALTEFSYPTDTWVVTSFRLCNVQHGGAPGNPITSRNPATAQITVNGTTYNIPNIYIPRGGEQVVWVKWRTPSTPQTLIMSATASKGLFYNVNNAGSSNMYVDFILAEIEIYDNDMERVPPDPTLNDTAASIGYTPSGAASGRSSLMSGAQRTNSWFVWDCNFIFHRSYTQTYTSWSGLPSYPTGNSYNEVTGIYTERTVVSSGSEWRYDWWWDDWYLERWVVVRFDEYIYNFNRIVYNAEVRNSYVRIKPDVNVPTAYTQGNTTFMKSGYGINVEVEPFIRITMRHEGTGATSTNSYFAASTTNFAAAPQYIFAYFPEFRYSQYFRQLQQIGGQYVFRQNKFSTFNERTHYTPWWFPDNANYEIVARSDFAYTPSGQLRLFEVSDAIRIEKNLMDDWRIAPFF